MEREFIQWLRTQTPTDASVPLSIGDDAAILQLASGSRCVISTDLLTDGVDFLFDEVTPERIGRKALAVNLSDMAAMGATPFAALVSLVVPHHFGVETMKDLYRGIFELAQSFQLPIVGGDTNSWDGALAISITILGQNSTRGPWLRSGAKPDDLIVVTGQLGGSILSKHFDFTPRVKEALLINEDFEVHAATDISDGLSRDLSNVLSESSCGAVLDLDLIPISDDAKRLSVINADAKNISPIDHALDDGEDFELILAMPFDEAERLVKNPPCECPITVIGRFVSEKGLWVKGPDGIRQPRPPRGFEHQI